MNLLSKLYEHLPEDYCVNKEAGENQRRNELARGLTPACTGGYEVRRNEKKEIIKKSCFECDGKNKECRFYNPNLLK